jgi:hypothetical protein
MAGVILPKIHVERIMDPLIFLAGPIRSAPNWQDEAIGLLFSMRREIVIASPRRERNARLLPYYLCGREDFFHRQRAWERHYLDMASRTGAVMFWLPGEEKHSCRKSYGAMTRIELGQWMTNYRNDSSVRLCVGSDGRFSELDTIVYDLYLDAPDMKVFKSLEETCAEAIRLSLRE